MKVSFLLRTGPYSYENVDVVYHLSKSLIENGHQVSIFFFEDGILNIVNNIKSPQERNIAEMMQDLSDLGARLTGCGTCGKFRGVGRKTIIPGATLSGLATLSKIVKESDRMLTFGY